ncbi:Ppx/GppA family phosphatase [Mucilaginibacter robiniae]|uniref:Ppx/GppA family phosphatase n=1 Tax=Mucilaginibacter robiniae TaxID=2728022 RepID=A0A7L5E3U6_9SPHI|nr:Ppx/GppA phosphatase family protein [Mucilaginibacter robiniae]QJD98002.1 Ppx/GppA family phosphatase [Mucilaginibacter robiniae]
MTNRVAVIDLGTNTFHLLIAEPGQSYFFTELLHKSEAVKLGEGGINDGVIRPDAYQRGIAAMNKFQQYILQYNVQQVKALATSAMRSATNGQQFIDEVKAQTGIQIGIILGDTEAQYIYQGVKASNCLQADNSLIVDIGGGSVELIIGNNEHITYKQSFEIGAARLMALFHQTDPIPPSSIQDLYAHLDNHLQPMLAAVARNSVINLIGSSGAFETFAELAERDKGYDFELKQNQVYTFNEQDFLKITNRLIQSSHDERLSMKGIIPVRIDMIVVASLITCYLLEKLQIKEVVMTAYSLKEGVLASMLNQQVLNKL